MEGTGPISSQTKRVVLCGTFDSKGTEYAYLRDRLLANNSNNKASTQVQLCCVNVGVLPYTAPFTVDYEASQVAKAGGGDLEALRDAKDRGTAMQVMSKGLAQLLQSLHATNPFAAVIGCGGTGGTSVITAAMRALPPSVVKVCVSTAAGTETMGQFVGGSNIVVVPSIVDIAGLNSVLRRQFDLAASGLYGMLSTAAPKNDEPQKPIILASMFGNTTGCVTKAVELLTKSEQYEVLVFHAVGAGGRSLESYVETEGVTGVLDVTTTELADELCGGVFSAGPERLDGPGKAGIPHLIAPGCLDMVNFNSMESVPARYREDKSRKFYEWNPNVTLMRTSVDENKKLGTLIAEKANAAKGPVAILLPKRGFSILGEEGGVFHDKAADNAFIEAVKSNVQKQIQVHELDTTINAPEFSEKAVAILQDLIHNAAKHSKQEKSEKAQSDHDNSSSNNAKHRQQHAPWIEKIPEKPTNPREAVLHNLRKCIDQGRPIIGAGAGTGISAKFEEAGGADMIVIYNSGRFRMAGRGSLAGLLPFKDANKIVVEMAAEVLPVVRRDKTPVLAGVCATDPFRNMDTFLRKLRKIGFAGVQNFPTVGLIDGTFRMNLEETGMSYSMEVEMIRKARQLGLLTTPYVFNVSEARQMAEAGADVIVAHMGLTTTGSIGAVTAVTLADCVPLIQEIADVVKSINTDAIVLCHGGPIASAEDAQFILRQTTNVHGFYGASSMERLPVETAITDCMRGFKKITFSQE
eukprot:TRINITY_DN3357_c0_g3_i1.p1 TRINITY_DN3357_c0_g3~~TRINITY_DN3357_c0_g3_i1.p1  ORF type:complete len:749 (-),score=125.00 TRINITY_DN3357_c0_g3_i1:2-2248(-)